MRRWFLQALVPALAAILVVVVVLLMSQWARDALRGDAAHQFAFRDIECQPPAGRSRDEFLAEVQYLSGLPDRFDLLDPTLARRLEVAFEREPWVSRSAPD